MASPEASRRHVAHTVGATILAGVATYVFLGIVSRSLGEEQYDLFSVYWSIALIVGFGLFLPVEQELARFGGASLPAVPAARAGTRVALEIAAVVLLLLAAASPLLLAAGLTVEFLLVTAAAVLVSALQFAARGAMLVRRRMAAYANVLGIDSLLRIAFAVSVAVAVTRPEAVQFAVVLLVAIAAAHLPVLVASLRGATHGEQRMHPAVRRAAVALLAGTIAAQLLLNVSPLIINAAPVEAGTAGAFQSTFSLARIPLFLLVPLQGIVVGPLAGLVAAGRTRRMTALMARVALVISAVGVAGAAAAYAIGPWAVELVFGPGRSLPALDVALLVLGVCVHVGLVVATQALIAAQRHGRASVAWVAAIVLFALVCLLLWSPLGPVTAASVAFLAGSALGWGLALGELRGVARSVGESRENSRMVDCVLALNYYTPYVSGLTNVARDVAEGLARAGHTVTVVASQHDPKLPLEEMVGGVRVVRSPVRLRFGKGVISPAFLSTVLREAEHADVVNLHLPMLEAGYLAPRARRRGAKVAITYQCDVSLPPGLLNRVQQRAIDWSSRTAARAADAVIVSSADYADNSRIAADLAASRFVIPPGCHSRPPGNPDFRETSGLHVGFLGRLVEEKGIEYLVEGFTRLTDPDARLLIGGDFAGIAGGSVIDRVRRAIGEDPRIRILGFLPDDRLADFYASLDVFALTSVNSFEAFGIVQVEAMMAGVPALASDLPGVRQPARATGFGTIVPPRDSAAITRALEALPGQSFDREASASEAARLYGLPSVLERYEQLFVDLAAQR